MNISNSNEQIKLYDIFLFQYVEDFKILQEHLERELENVNDEVRSYQMQSFHLFIYLLYSYLLSHIFKKMKLNPQQNIECTHTATVNTYMITRKIQATAPINSSEASLTKTPYFTPQLDSEQINHHHFYTASMLYTIYHHSVLFVTDTLHTSPLATCTQIADGSGFVDEPYYCYNCQMLRRTVWQMNICVLVDGPFST